MGMKVCKLVRLTKKDKEGNFVASDKEGQILIRKRAIISEESLNDAKGSSKHSGLLYVIDESATKDRDAEIAKSLEVPAASDVAGNSL
jgi:hypothetical protein